MFSCTIFHITTHILLAYSNYNRFVFMSCKNESAGVTSSYEYESKRRHNPFSCLCTFEMVRLWALSRESIRIKQLVDAIN